MRTILHSDLNNFYATCEVLMNPCLLGKPVVVCGKIEDRHGIVLAKNYEAKKYDIKTGDTLYEAKKKCPMVVAVEANFGLYLKYSRLVKKIYAEYTDRIESFGIDEAWLDVTGSQKLFGSGEEIAEKIRNRVKEEIGLTVSIGVSFNKIFAKLGSDLKKPDAVTIIDKNNFKEKIWGLAASDLLFVGRATNKKLADIGIYTIGDIARADVAILKMKMGKWGEYLWNFANGFDDDPVKKTTETDEVKSVGNSLTFYRDLVNEEDVSSLIYMLSESVAARMMDYGIPAARTVRLFVIDNTLASFVRQAKMKEPSSLSADIAETAMELFKKNFSWQQLVRGVGVSVCDFTSNQQLAIGEDEEKRERQKVLQESIEKLRSRFGRTIINRGMMLSDNAFKEMNIKDEHIIHPVSFL